MIVDFLEAADGTPLTKTFVRNDDGTFDTVPYPQVYHVTSHRFDVQNIREFYNVLVEQAEKNHCMLKGELDRDLTNETRAGHTDPTMRTGFIVLDLDFEDGWESVDAFLYDVDPELANVSYVLHHSASSGIKYGKGLRSHVIMMLDQPMLPGTLKHWLRRANLRTPKLKERTSLTAAGTALKWPLDITTCQNDKLIYIAPPVCQNFEDPIDERLEFIKKQRDRLNTKEVIKRVNIPATDKLQADQVAALRKAEDKPPLRPRYQKAGSIEVQTNHDKAQVTSWKTARGFTYVNLNGGDSWGYYFPEHDPEILFNFKGEDNVYLRALDPDFYEAYKELLHAKLQHDDTSEADIVPYAIHDVDRDQYVKVLRYPKEDHLELYYTASKAKLVDFMKQYSAPIPEYVEDWTIEFAPQNDKRFDEENKWVNMFSPTPLMKYAQSANKPENVPPVVAKTLLSICGDDMECVEHFLNWLAYIFQYRQKAKTAWLFQSVQGVGKGQFFDRILLPIFSNEYCITNSAMSFGEIYNSQFEKALIIWMDEFKPDSGPHNNQILDKMKNLITEPTMQYRRMHANPYNGPSFSNVIVTSNYHDAIRLEPSDRRWNVPPYQETKIQYTDEELRRMSDEAPEFAAFLEHYEANVERACKPILTDARTKLIRISTSSHEEFFKAFAKGDLAYFIEYVSEKSVTTPDRMRAETYNDTVFQWLKEADAGAQSFMDINGLTFLYNWLHADRAKPNKVRKMCDVHNLDRMGSYYVTYFKYSEEETDFFWDRFRHRLPENEDMLH